MLGARVPLKYAVAALATMAALGLRLALGRYALPPYIFFYPTVMIVALTLGPGPGVVSTALSVAFVIRWVLPNPALELGTTISLTVFATMGVLISAVAYRNRVVRDALHAAEAQRARSRYEVLSERGRDLIVFVRKDNGQVLEANAAAQAAYGYPRELLVGMNAERLGVTRDPPAAFFEAEHRRQDGSTFAVEVALHEAEVDGVAVRVLVSREISDRRAAEAALKASEERYSTVFGNAPFGLALSTLDRIIVDANQAFFTLFGLTRDDTIGRSSIELGLNDEASRERVGQIFAREGRVRDVEVTRRDASGALRHLSLSVERVAVGGLPMFLSSMQDVTARHEAQERLAAERKRLAVTLESIGDAVIATDRSAKVTVFNSVAETLTGHSAAEALGRPLNEIFALLSEDTHEPTLNPVDRVLKEGKVVALANHALLLNRDGTERPIANSGAPIRDDQGEVTGVVLVFRDQSAERLSQAALRSSEALLRSITDVIPDPIFLKDAQGRRLFANPAALAVLGKPPAEVLGKTDRELHSDPAIGESVMATDRRIMLSGQPEILEEQLPTPWGERVYLSTKIPNRDAEGRVVGLVGVARDITERKRLDEALRERDYLLSESQRIAHVGTWTWELPTDTLRWSDESYRIYGVARDHFELTPASFLALIHADDREAVRGWTERCKRGERVEDVVFRAVRPDGTVRLVRRRGEFVAASPERPAHMSGTIQDITEQRLAEDRFRALIDNSSDMIVVLDAQGRITFWSRSCEDQLGFSAQEVLGRLGRELIHPDDWGPLHRTGALFTSPGLTLRNIRRQLHKDGSSRLCEVVATNLLEDPAVRGVVANMRDITLQRRLEDQLRQSQKLESIGQLAGGVAHDFNNLLTVILSCAEALQSAHGRGKPIDGELIDEIAVAGSRAADLTRQLLAFARKQVITPVPTEVGAVVKGSEKLLRRVLGEDIVLEVRSVPSPWLVRCDPGQLEQVILNLAVNARDAMPRGGTLTIETSHLELTPPEAASRPTVQPGEWVRLTVRDTGTGMTEDVKAHLFEPFFTTKGVGQGTGLGLATVYGIVTQSGGHLQVESAPGQGSTFEVLLPRTLEVAADGGVQVATLVRGSERILLVEDDAQVRASNVRVLKSGGYDVLVAPDSQAALNFPAELLEGVRLLITDVVMPGVDGRTLADALGRKHPGLRVLFVSGYTRDALADHGVTDSGMAFLSKPFTGPTLLARVRALLDASSERA